MCNKIVGKGGWHSKIPSFELLFKVKKALPSRTMAHSTNAGRQS